jgi:predicted nucleotidyltransferase
MDKNEAINISRNYSRAVLEKLKPKRIVLYGSYAKGNYTDDSDIDIAVVVDKIGDNYLEKVKELFRLRRNIDLRIEPVLLEDGNDPSGFIDTIDREGIVLYNA